jgi:DNA-directed RNA polymerase delta subunit
MDEDKIKKLHKQLNSQKFERLTFAVDYIMQIQKMKQLEVEDIMEILSRLYDEALIDGKITVLETKIHDMFMDLDGLYPEEIR